MFLKRVMSFVVVLSTVMVCGFSPVGATGQVLPRDFQRIITPFGQGPSSFKRPKPLSFHPVTPGEKASAAQKETVSQAMTPVFQVSSTQIFRAAITSSSGGQETLGTAAADLNGDGKLDVVMASQCAVDSCSSGLVTVLLGNGDGTYQTPVSYNVAYNAQAVAIADINGDGKGDILAVSYCNSDCSSGVLSVLLGNGDGTFQSAVTDNTGGPISKDVVVQDVNGDSKLDVLILDVCVTINSCSSGVVGVLLGNGDGTFQTATSYALGGSSANSLAVADVNGDGKPDIAAVSNCENNSDCSNGLVSLLLGNGDGTFQSAATFSSGAVYADSVAIADVNGDHHADLLIAHECNDNTTCANGAVSVLLGNGDGTFQVPVQYNSGGQNAQSLAVGDFNNDGKPDVAVSNECASNSTCQDGSAASVLLGNGDGTFQLSASYSSGSENFDELEGPSITTVGVADVNGDGNPDVLVSNSCDGTSYICGSGSLNVLLGAGDGTLMGGVIYAPAGWAPYGLASADINGDGKPDIIVADECGSSSDCTSAAVSVLINNGDGSFQSGAIYASGGASAQWVAAADLNGDGNSDVVVANTCASSGNCSHGSVGVLLGNGDGTFQDPVTYSTSTYPYDLVLADVNGDSKLDIVLAQECSDSNCTSGAVNVLLGNGDGTFQNAATYNSGGIYALSVAVADANGDGKADIIVSNQCTSNSNCSDGLVSVLLGNGDGTFQSAVNYNSGGLYARSIQAADMNGDGKPDVVVLNTCASDCSNSAISVLLGNGDGTFQTATSSTIPRAEFQQGIVIGDFNGDHKLDVASGGSNVLLLGNGDGTLQPEMSLGASGPDTIVGDFNADGRPDLAVGGVAILLNISDGFVFSTTTVINIPTNPSSFGESVDLSATVASVSGGAPTGTVAFTDGTTQLGQATLSNGSAILSTSALAIGSHSITAAYGGDSNHTASTSSAFIQVVAKSSTSIALVGTPNPASIGQSITFTATVAPATSGVPSGKVNFFDGSTLLGSATLSSGVARFLTSALTAGSHSITAMYVGDSNYSASTSSTVNAVVNGAADFTITTSALTPTSIPPGGSAQWTITINPSGSFNPGTVSLSCGVTPVVSSPLTCSMSSVSVSGGVGKATLSVTSISAQSAVKQAKLESKSSGALLLALFIPGLCLGGLGMSKPNRGKLLGLGVAILLVGGCMLQTACGGTASPTPSPAISGTPQGTYTVTVTGTSGGVKQTTTVAVTVQ